MAIDCRGERHVHLGTLGLVALAAYFQATAAMSLLAAALAARPLARADEAEPAAPSARRASKSAAAILARNPFDSVTGPLVEEPPERGAALARGGFGFDDPLAAPACDGIRVTVISESRDKAWSMVTLQLAGETRPRLLRPGDEVTGKHVAHIGHNPKLHSPAVWLSDRSSICQALLLAAAPVLPAEAPMAATSALEPALAAIQKQIRKISATEFEADRAVIDQVLNNQALLMQRTRIVPEQQDGKVIGIRLFGIRPDTLLGIVGIENGDRLESINGLEMGSPQKMLEAYARLPAASNLTVKINRRGQPVTIDYRLR